MQATGVVAKLIAFDEANISAARNLGIVQAAGDVVAFLDDDAVPEPTWLSRLVAPFEDRRVVAATGFVRGRNGISYQWQASEVDAQGRDWSLEVGEGVSLHAGNAQRAVKTQGTNCAFRREALLAVGGFDPAYRFYLDEADLNLRMAGAGLTAVVPDAQVHHGFAASTRRRGDRVPRTLFDIGASTAVFLRRHGTDRALAPAIAWLIAEQQARALRHMVAGRIEPRDVKRLMRSLMDGLDAGGSQALKILPKLQSEAGEFLPLPDTGPRDGRVIAVRSWQADKAIRQATEAVSRGEVVTLMRFSPTALFHKQAFDPKGFWLQAGGQFGRSDRAETLVQRCGFEARVAQETRRVAPFRPVGSVLSGT